MEGEAGLHPGLQLLLLSASTWDGQGRPGWGSVCASCCVFRLGREMGLSVLGFKENTSGFHLLLKKVSIQIGEVCKQQIRPAQGSR